MDPLIHYATTTDGVSIAFWTMGEGPPLVIPPILASCHLELEWQIPSRRAAYEGLAQACRVIRYDCRGMGMSQRDTIDFSVEAAIRDLESVLDRASIEEFTMLRLPGSGDLPFAYPAIHPERVTKCVIWEGHTQDDGDSPRSDHLLAMEPVLEHDWELYARVRARLIAGWDGSNAPLLEEILRATHTPDSMRAVNAAAHGFDPLPYLPEIQAHSLVIYRIGVRQREEHARLFASRIPSAHLVGAREASIGSYPSSAGVESIVGFVDPGRARQAFERLDSQSSGLRVILFTDLEKHTSMMQRLGDEAGRAVLREHEIITREALASYGGTEVKSMGDGFMASFGSATAALDCAIAIQRAFARRNEAADEMLRVRVGLSAGEPIAEEDDLFGASVIQASRIATQAKGGEIVLANVVRELSAGKGFLFSDRGEVALRGFDDPVHLYELRWDQSGV